MQKIWLATSFLGSVFVLLTAAVVANERNSGEFVFELPKQADPILIKASIGSKDVSRVLFLDTGFTRSHLYSDARLVYPVVRTAVPVVRMFENDTERTCRIDFVRLGGLEIGPHEASFGNNRIHDGFGVDVDGFLGGSTIDGFCLRMDFARLMGSISGQPLREDDGAAQRFSLKLGVPQIPVDMGHLVPCLIDTGNMHPFSVTNVEIKRFDERAVRVVDLGPSQAGTRPRIWAIVRRVELAEAETLDAVGPVANVATVGLRILRRYRMAIDYPRGQVAFRPREDMPERIAPDACGIFFQRQAEGTFVRDVYLKGVAHEAGLRVGDRVVSLDGQPIERLSFGQIYDLLARGGEQVTFVVDQPIGAPAKPGEVSPVTRRTIRFQLRWPFTWPPKWPEKAPVKRPIPVD
jgi:hypothetical protein